MVATPWPPPPPPPRAAASHMAVTQAFADALRSCGARGALSGARALHGRLVAADIAHPNVITHNVMLNGYAKLGRLSDAVELFDRMPARDVA
ncbi:unnamed protein product [Urochloa humidicola]